ncbi:MAG: helix-turn-helix domain-containing protein [cyanobacterium endosymbiont of Rhopalodia sterrenbergii]
MSNYNSSQIQQLRELGAYLCQQRLERSLTLEQIATSTFIHLSILKALEKGNVDELPEFVYVRGFVRRYGEALNIDGHSLANQLLLQQVEESSSEISPEFVTLSPVEFLGKNLSSLLLCTQTTAKIRKKAFSLIPLPSTLKIYGFVLLVVGTVTGLFYLFSASQFSESSSQNKTSEVVKTLSKESQNIADRKSQTDSNIFGAVSSKFNTASAAQNVSQKPVDNRKEKQSVSTEVNPNIKSSIARPQTNTTSQFPQELILSDLNSDSSVAASVVLEEDSWMRIKIDGETEYEGILGKGTQQTWTAQKTLIIRAGNAGAVNLIVNDQPSRKLGNVGEVQEVTLTTNS